MTPENRREDLIKSIEKAKDCDCRKNHNENLADFVVRREDALLASHKEMLGRVEKPLKEIYQRMGDDPYEKIRCWGPLMYHAIEKSLAIIHSAKGKV